MTNLWPKDIAIENSPRAPIAILKEQAASLGRLTDNIVTAEIHSMTPTDGDFTYTFSVVAPILGGYRYRLFTAHHSVELYPLRFELDGIIRQELAQKSEKFNQTGFIVIPDEEALIEVLKAIFNSQKTRKVINAMIAQSKAMSE